MTDTSVGPGESTLVQGPDVAEKPKQSLIAQVAAEYGVHPLKQMKDILLMRLGSRKLGANEYYDLRVFEHDRAARRAFLGQGAINALNRAINPDRLMETKNLVGNKLVYTAKLAEAGIASTRTQAFVATIYPTNSGFVLKTAEAVTAFMKDKAEYPLFCKPQGGSLSVGSVYVDRIDGDTLHLGDGRTVPVDRFAEDVLRVYKDGYLLQSALRPHKDMMRVTGKAVGCVRVVTVRDGATARPVYAVWKLPAPKAMSDNSWQDGTMLSLLDLADGTVLSCHRGKGPDAEMLREHPVSQHRVVGLQIPFWSQIIENACAAHELTPELGICGFDIAVTDDGPVILECNDRPNHMLYQFPARRGIRNPDFNPVWNALVARRS